MNEIAYIEALKACEECIDPKNCDRCTINDVIINYEEELADDYSRRHEANPETY